MPVIVGQQDCHRVVVVRNAAVTAVRKKTAAVEVERREKIATVTRQTALLEVSAAGVQGQPGPEGPPGPAGGDVVVRTAATILGGHRVVRAIDAQRVALASANDSDHGDDVLGLTLGAAEEGADVQVQVAGEVTEPSWAWTPQEPLWLGLDGLLTQTPPAEADAAFSLVVGFATSPTSIRIRFETPIYF